MQTGDSRTWSWPLIVSLMIVQVWAAHAIAFFTHEYAHAVVAWLLGWKHNPLDLDYAKPSLAVFLIQLGINQKVDEAPIYAAGHALDVALIAGAGVLLGNGLINYPLSRLGYRQAKRRNHRGWAMFAFWLTAASIGNFIDYMPIRTFTGGQGDMGSLETGLGWPPWLVLIVLGLPTLLATAHFVMRIVPATVGWLFPDSPGARYGVALGAIFFVFGFYGAAGLLEGGPISFDLSLVSVFAVLPLTWVVEVLLLRRTALSAD